MRTLFQVKPPKISRRISKDYAKRLRARAKTVGLILWAWNDIHSTFARVFAWLIDRSEPKIGLAGWHALKADTAQRDMLTALLEQYPNLPEDISEGFDWLLRLSGKLSQHRNDVAHTPMMYIGGLFDVFMVDALTGDPAKVVRLHRSDIKTFHNRLIGDLIALSSYARRLERALKEAQPREPLPKRPPLQSLPHSEVPLTRSQKRRREAMQQRKRQRQS